VEKNNSGHPQRIGFSLAVLDLTAVIRKAQNEAEKDFYEGVKFLHMSIQFLRNEKAHTPAKDLDKNLAIHYISLASLAYDLITRK